MPWFVASVKHFENYLAGLLFELVTDHQALTSLSSTRNQNRRLTRWSLFLQDFRYEAKSDRALRMRMPMVCPDSAGGRRTVQSSSSLMEKYNILDEGDVAGLD